MKTIKNEISKTHINSLEKELFPINKKLKNKKKEIPIFFNHSDYYYYPESKMEKCLKDEIMKYLYENNLVNNTKNKKNQNKNYKRDKNNDIMNNKIENKKDKESSLKENKIIHDEIDNSYEKINQKEENKISNEKINSNYTLKNYIDQMENKSTDNQFQINQINNINIENLYITKDNNINIINTSLNKQEEITKNTETTKDDSYINIKVNNKQKLTKYKFCFNNGMFSCNKNNKKEKNKNKSINSYKNKINLIKKINNPYSDKSNILRNFSEIESNIKKSEKNKNKQNLSTISLQSINDSKLLILANELIPKDEEFDKLKANDILYKRNNNII